jgi:hypothetical protein
VKVKLESLTALVLIAGCAAPAQQAAEGPGVAFPMSFGEGDGEPEAASRSQPVRASSTQPSKQSAIEGGTPKPPTDRAAEHRVKYGSLPVPPPLFTKSQWELTLRYDKGNVSLSSVKQRELPTPVSTTRHMGRFAFELWIGRELIDRVRFNFPLVTGVQASRQGTSDPVPLDKGAQGATSTQTLLVPHSPRATRAVLVDRASGKETWLPWPPHRPSGPERAEISEAPPEKP